MSKAIEFFGLSQTVAELAETEISKVAKYGWGRQGLIPLWFGEGDVPTPKYICDTASESMQLGETFYTDQNGLSVLRNELIKYTKRSFGVALEDDRVTVTSSGMMAISLTMQMLINPGDEVVVIGPVWPNIYSTVELNNGIITHASIKMGDDGWSLDLN
jgi:aspartate/methionine/tyrosine aminotransferase